MIIDELISYIEPEAGDQVVKDIRIGLGYTHVLSKEAFLVAPDGDDMLALVAAKLKLKIPPTAPK